MKVANENGISIGSVWREKAGGHLVRIKAIRKDPLGPGTDTVDYLLLEDELRVQGVGSCRLKQWNDAYQMEFSSKVEGVQKLLTKTKHLRERYLSSITTYAASPSTVTPRTIDRLNAQIEILDSIIADLEGMTV